MTAHAHFSALTAYWSISKPLPMLRECTSFPWFERSCIFLCAFNDGPFSRLPRCRQASIGVTTGSTFCGVIGHVHRHEYTGKLARCPHSMVGIGALYILTPTHPDWLILVLSCAENDFTEQNIFWYLRYQQRRPTVNLFAPSNYLSVSVSVSVQHLFPYSKVQNTANRNGI